MRTRDFCATISAKLRGKGISSILTSKIIQTRAKHHPHEGDNRKRLTEPAVNDRIPGAKHNMRENTADVLHNSIYNAPFDPQSEEVCKNHS
jgi:hypothetical protein